ncbi:heavy metal translocating P-type ATPase [Clostridium sp. 'White wine YQ']|uniref:heavy metal translocating P-type ATPase n=1 Tax=Clostridium sp. 'White wine YQ' TaxID=3027474 RepID=UPI002365F800|nr:heavy metal translocating P-type ATPase [Clostridium sp. 'White wine YQ']MDD7795790.1 heavy metal translocating P-type ATPase [Clostridium sp. 'White wine YQ']
MKEIKLLLEGLDCANCAAKIESRVNALEEVEEASLNFSSNTLAISPKEATNLDLIKNKVEEIVIKLEPHVKVKEVLSSDKAVRSNIQINKTEEEHKEEHHDHEHTHEHNHEHSHEGFDSKELIKLVIGIIFYGIGFFFKGIPYVEVVAFGISYVIVGGEVLITALKNIRNGEVFDENFLMTIATIGAFAIGEYPEGAAVMIFYGIGEMFQGYAVNKSRKSIGQLMDIRPDYANKMVNEREVKVSPEEVAIGDIIIVKPGEKVPLDGKVVNGEAMMDTSALTGESLPRKVSVGNEVLSGSINKNSPIKIEVTKTFGESTVSKILELVENAGNKKAKTEKFITKFARYYTPAVVFSALALAVIPPVIGLGSFSQWIYRALIFLVVSCPCALVISIPLAFFGGIGAASKHGILIKGGNYLEALKSVDTVIFDKTGTLTKGVFSVTKIYSTNEYTNEEILECAAYAESYSNHPIAESIKNAFNGSLDNALISDYKEIAGKGISVVVRGKKIIAGNEKLMVENNIVVEDIKHEGTLVYIALEGEYIGAIVISDEIKKDSDEAIKMLKSLGIKETVMLTGDNKATAEAVNEKLNLDKVYSELLPQDKVEKVEEILSNKNDDTKVIFVGDGINDAPVLARADIGIAMGGVGSDAAIEAADIVIMTDEPSKIAKAISISKTTSLIVKQNIIFALGIKALVLILAVIGLGTMWEGVFADVGVALLAVLNSMRILRKNKVS